MQISRSSMQLHIKQLEEDNARLKRELAETLDAQKQSLMVRAYSPVLTNR